MIVDELREQLDQLGKQYWEGRENLFIRYWTYLDRGLDMFNQFKYYIGFPLVAAAFIPFLEGKTMWLVVMTVFGLPILILAGRYKLHRINKTTEYVNAITGSIFQFKPMELTLEQVNLLKEIRDSLKELKGR